MEQPAEQETVATRARQSVRPVHGRSSFSLIELLVVVAIIMVLVGIALKVTGVVSRQGGRARTLWVLEQVKNALGAYYTANGAYPPASSVSCVVLGSGPSGVVPDGGWGEKRGLAYYLYNVADHPKHNPDPEAARWARYLEKIGEYGWESNSKPSSANFTWVFWTNKVHRIHDGWERDLNYTSSPPSYQEFRLWSSGPNGINEYGDGDDIGVKWTE